MRYALQKACKQWAPDKSTGHSIPRLPFVSAGGSGLVLTAIAAGVLVNVARQGKKYNRSRVRLKTHPTE